MISFQSIMRSFEQRSVISPHLTNGRSFPVVRNTRSGLVHVIDFRHELSGGAMSNSTPCGKSIYSHERDEGKVQRHTLYEPDKYSDELPEISCQKCHDYVARIVRLMWHFGAQSNKDVKTMKGSVTEEQITRLKRTINMKGITQYLWSIRPRIKVFDTYWLIRGLAGNRYVLGNGLNELSYYDAEWLQKQADSMPHTPTRNSHRDKTEEQRAAMNKHISEYMKLKHEEYLKARRFVDEYEQNINIQG